MQSRPFFSTSRRVTDTAQKENLGILVQYKVKIKLFLGSLGGELVAELPFTLMHPKPIDDGSGGGELVRFLKFSLV